MAGREADSVGIDTGHFQRARRAGGGLEHTEIECASVHRIYGRRFWRKVRGRCLRPAPSKTLKESERSRQDDAQSQRGATGHRESTELYPADQAWREEGRDAD